jgi:hypothetical protein
MNTNSPIPARAMLPGEQSRPPRRLAWARRKQPALRIRDILVPTDFSKPANFALRYAMSAASQSC